MRETCPAHRKRQRNIKVGTGKQLASLKLLSFSYKALILNSFDLDIKYS